MVIAVNTRLLLKDRLEGIGNFTAESLKRIVQSHPEHTFIFIFDRTYSQEFIFGDNVIPVVLKPVTRHPLLIYIWFQLRLPKVLKKYKADVFLSPDGFLSEYTKVPQLDVIHDLNFENYPKHLPWAYRAYYREWFPRFAKKAQRIATVSEFSKQDIQHTYGVDNEKIDVVYNGASHFFKPASKEGKQQIQKGLTDGKEYFIYVGSIHPRKNINNLLRAFDHYKKESGEDKKLVIVGAPMWKNSDVEVTVDNMQFAKDVIFTGRLNDQELADVMAGAYALVYVSFFEGFGIPILEAMNCDIPVITSSVTSMPEVGGDAAIYVSPFSVTSIADGMLEITQKPEVRQTLIEKGRVQRENFSWDKTASLLWQSIEKTIQ